MYVREREGEKEKERFRNRRTNRKEDRRRYVNIKRVEETGQQRKFVREGESECVCERERE